MTEFRDQSNQRSAKESARSMSKMYLFFINVLFAFCLSDVCRGYSVYENRAEFVTEGEVFNNSDNELTNGLENEWNTLLMEEPDVVVVELRQVLLENLKSLPQKENETYTRGGKITLATFDSTGLQDVTLYDDDTKFHQALISLSTTQAETEIPSPSMHVLVELLRRNLSRCSFVLVTMTKPSDEDFANDLMRALLDNKCLMSVLWMGSQATNDHLSLKIIAEKTGGRLLYPEDKKNNFQRSNFEEFQNFSKIRFPERSTENEVDMRLMSKGAGQKVIQKAVVPLIIEVASGSSLEIRPGTSTQVQFTVKNNMNVAVAALFRAKFNGIMQNVQPPQAYLPPASTITVIVNLQPLGNGQSVNAVGTLTLFATFGDRGTARSALISMTPQTTTDNTAPKMSYRYDGDCSNYKEPQNCEYGQWNLEVTLQDEDSGLLKILSEPYGLLFHSEFIAGTKTPITAYYSATCCQPTVHVWGEDLRGNYVKKSFDVFNQNLLTGEIASIVLGVLLLLLIITVIIAAVVLIRRRNQRNLIIPRARSGSR